MCTNKWLILNKIASVKKQYLKPFNFLWTNYWYLIELLVLDNNILNHLNVGKQMIYFK